MIRLIVWSIALALALLSARQAVYWQTNLSLWTRAVSVAPRKPSLWINLAVSQMAAGQYDAARRSLNAAEAAIVDPAVSGWERRDVVAALAADREALRDLQVAAAVRSTLKGQQ